MKIVDILKRVEEYITSEYITTTKVKKDGTPFLSIVSIERDVVMTLTVEKQRVKNVWHYVDTGRFQFVLEGEGRTRRKLIPKDLKTLDATIRAFVKKMPVYFAAEAEVVNAQKREANAAASRAADAAAVKAVFGDVLPDGVSVSGIGRAGLVELTLSLTREQAILLVPKIKELNL